MGRFIRFLIKLEDLLSKRNILIALTLTIGFTYFCLPYTKYCILNLDRHYVGIFVDPLPPLAKGSKQEEYYATNGIPYRTHDGIRESNKEAIRRKGLGLPMVWDEQMKKDMELYPLIERPVNYLKAKRDTALHIGAHLKKVAVAAKNRAHRMLATACKKDSNCDQACYDKCVQDEKDKAKASKCVTVADGGEQATYDKCIADEKAKKSGPGGSKVAQDEEQVELSAKKNVTTSYPTFMSEEQIRGGGFLVYLFGMVYMFIGIALVTQGYINPAIDIVKKKGIVSINCQHFHL